jgi:hypothetical protein
MFSKASGCDTLILQIILINKVYEAFTKFTLELPPTLSETDAVSGEGEVIIGAATVEHNLLNY